MSTTEPTERQNQRTVAYLTPTTQALIPALKERYQTTRTSDLINKLLQEAAAAPTEPLQRAIDASNMMLRILIAASINPDDLRHIVQKMSDEITTINRIIDEAIATR